jgi:hypothetical protein
MKGLKSIPSVVQLPGGVQLRSIPFKIIERFPNGTPKTFQIEPQGQPVIGVDRCALFAQEEAIRHPSFGTGSKLK